MLLTFESTCAAALDRLTKPPSAWCCAVGSSGHTHPNRPSSTAQITARHSNVSPSEIVRATARYTNTNMLHSTVGRMLVRSISTSDTSCVSRSFAPRAHFRSTSTTAQSIGWRHTITASAKQVATISTSGYERMPSCQMRKPSLHIVQHHHNCLTDRLYTRAVAQASSEPRKSTAASGIAMRSLCSRFSAARCDKRLSQAY